MSNGTTPPSLSLSRSGVVHRMNDLSTYKKESKALPPHRMSLSHSVLFSFTTARARARFSLSLLQFLSWANRVLMFGQYLDARHGNLTQFSEVNMFSIIYLSRHRTWVRFLRFSARFFTQRFSFFFVYM